MTTNKKRWRERHKWMKSEEREKERKKTKKKTIMKRKT